MNNLLLVLALIDIIKNKNGAIRIFKTKGSVEKECCINDIRDKIQYCNSFINTEYWLSRIFSMMIAIEILYYIYGAIYVNNLNFITLSVFLILNHLRIYFEGKEMFLMIGHEDYEYKSKKNRWMKRIRNLAYLMYPVILISVIITRLIDQ